MQNPTLGVTEVSSIGVMEITIIAVLLLAGRFGFTSLASSALTLLKRKVMSVPIGYWKIIISSVGAVACLLFTEITYSLPKHMGK